MKRQRTRMTEILRNRVRLVRWDDTEDRTVETVYMAPRDGGYVRIDDGNQLPQVCTGLYRMGDTLWWNGRRPLIDLIRREWRVRQRNERRERP